MTYPSAKGSAITGQQACPLDRSRNAVESATITGLASTAVAVDRHVF